MRRPLYAPRAFQHLPGNKFTRVPRYFKPLLLLLSTRSLRFIVITIYLYVYIYQIRRFFFRFFRNWKLSTKYSLRYGCLDGKRGGKISRRSAPSRVPTLEASLLALLGREYEQLIPTKIHGRKSIGINYFNLN